MEVPGRATRSDAGAGGTRAIAHTTTRLSRREFTKLTAGAAALAAGVVVRADEDIDTVYNRAPVVDALCLLDWTESDIDAWRRSGHTAVQISLANNNFDIAMRALRVWNAQIVRHSDSLILCTRAADVERAKTEGKLAVLLGFQNGAVIDYEIDNIDALHAAGARVIQLTYNARNLLGDGCTERTNAGLSDFGIECVERMNERGILVDLSHCGEQTTADGIAFSRKPPAFTHTMCKTVYDHVRAKPDAQLRALSEKGGVTGIVALGYFVGPTAATTFDDYLRHIDHAVNVCGIDHVGLASDFSIQGIEATATRESWYLPRLRYFKPSYRVRWPPWIPELDQPERYRTVAHALSGRGYKSAEIEKILGANWVRLYRDVFGG